MAVDCKLHKLSEDTLRFEIPAGVAVETGPATVVLTNSSGLVPRLLDVIVRLGDQLLDIEGWASRIPYLAIEIQEIRPHDRSTPLKGGDVSETHHRP